MNQYIPSLKLRAKAPENRPKVGISGFLLGRGMTYFQVANMLLVSGIFSRIESFLNFVFSQMPQLFVEVK